MILVRSSASRDKEFTVFDHNEREMVPEQPTTGSIHFVHGQSVSVQEVELAVKAVNSGDQSSQSDLYPNGITVTKTVITS